MCILFMVILKGVYSLLTFHCDIIMDCEEFAETAQSSPCTLHSFPPCYRLTLTRVVLAERGNGVTIARL